MNEDEQTLSFECELDAPPAQVWRALTEAELLAQWLMPNDFAPQEGHAFTFQADEPIECQVLAIERERTLRLRWREQRLDSVVTFMLTPARGGGTHLRIEHGGVERLRAAFPMLACAEDRKLSAAADAALTLAWLARSIAPHDWRAPRERKRRIGFALDNLEPETAPDEYTPLDPARIPLRTEPIGFERTVEHERILGVDRPDFRCAA